jgi:hypothetical protein
MKDYIVLSGSEASIEGDYLRWNLHPSYFSHWKHGDEVYVKLSSCNFIGGTTESSYATEYGNVVIESDLVVQNSFNTSGLTILSVHPVVLLNGDAGGGTVASSSESSTSPQLMTDRFNNIKLAFKYQTSYLDMSGAPLGAFVAILEVEYKSQKDNMSELLKLIGPNGSGSIRAGNMV